MEQNLDSKNEDLSRRRILNLRSGRKYLANAPNVDAPSLDQSRHGA
jgi:hypothetical protein